MKRYIPILFLLSFLTTSAQTDPAAKVGYYYSKEDYLNKKIAVQEKMIASENYNVGIINYLDKDNVERKFNCIKARVWGFRYLDGCDYIQMPDGFFAKIAIPGKRIDLLISPKATFKATADGTYTFTAEEGKKVSFYFVKNLDPATQAPFEKQIEDEKALLKEYQADRDNYGEFINKQLKYLEKYNAIVPKPKKPVKK